MHRLDIKAQLTTHYGAQDSAGNTVPVCVAAFTFKTGQPHPSGRIADNTLDQSLEQGIYALDLQRFVRLYGLADAVKLLLDTKVSKGADPELGGQVGTYAVLGQGFLCQFAGKADISGGSLCRGAVIHND